MTSRREFDRWFDSELSEALSNTDNEMVRDLIRSKTDYAIGWQAAKADQAERIKELEAIISRQNARLSQCEKLAQSVMLDIGDRNEH